MKKLVKKLILTLMILSLTVQSVPVKASQVCSKTSIPFSRAQADLQNAERKLWMDHVSWTRSYIISAIASLDDQKDVLERILRNQDEIGNAIKPYYGEEAGNQLAALLREHIELAGKVLAAAKTNNKSELDKYNKLWYENADKIAQFLSKANPYYPEKELKNMLYQHLKYVTDQVVARLNKNWKADIEAYDMGEEHMIHFADLLSEGIIKQFPDKFK